MSEQKKEKDPQPSSYNLLKSVSSSKSIAIPLATGTRTGYVPSLTPLCVSSSTPPSKDSPKEKALTPRPETFLEDPKIKTPPIKKDITTKEDICEIKVLLQTIISRLDGIDKRIKVIEEDIAVMKDTQPRSSKSVETSAIKFF